jgi:hypothetical protein
MLTFVFSPRWFYGIDIISEIFAVIVTLLISIFSFKIYRFCEDKKYKYLALSFFTLAVAFFFKILTNINVFYEVTKQKMAEGLVLTYSTLESSDLLVSIGVIGFRLLFLAGLMGLFYLLYKHRDKKLFIVMLWLILLATWFSLRNYFFFHATAILFMALLFWYYYMACKETLKKNSKKSITSLRYLMFTYWFLGLSQLAFIFVFLSLNLYAIAESLQIIAFLLLLFNMVTIFIKARRVCKV